jgi:glucan phosphoethanolaminetransferase (alkaline phosphatase superfamily)
LGDIIFWALIRIAIVIPAIWILRAHLDEQLWWLISIAAVYVIIIHPAFTAYKKFESKSKSISGSIICSSCKHFNESAFLCMKHDKHPSEDYIPCDGIHWEPK